MEHPSVAKAHPKSSVAFTLSPHSEMLAFVVFDASQTMPLGFTSILLLKKCINRLVLEEGIRITNLAQIAAAHLLAVFVHFRSEFLHFLLDDFLQLINLVFYKINSLIIMVFSPKPRYFSFVPVALLLSASDPMNGIAPKKISFN
jgi:hypothetical protein